MRGNCLPVKLEKSSHPVKLEKSAHLGGADNVLLHVPVSSVSLTSSELTELTELTHKKVHYSPRTQVHYLPDFRIDSSRSGPKVH